MNQESKLKEIGEIRNYLIEQINRNELVIKKHKKLVKFWITLRTCFL